MAETDVTERQGVGEMLGLSGGGVRPELVFYRDDNNRFKPKTTVTILITVLVNTRGARCFI